MKTKIIILKSGIVIRDSRSIGCGLSIENQNTKYMTLAHSSNEFYLNMKGFWLTVDKWDGYCKELDIMKASCDEANTIFGHEKTTNIQNLKKRT